MQKHCNKVHQTAWKSNEATLCEKVKAQTFFRAGGLQRYFIVDAANADSNPSVPRKVADVVNERLAEWQLTQRAQHLCAILHIIVVSNLLILDIVIIINTRQSPLLVPLSTVSVITRALYSVLEKVTKVIPLSLLIRVSFDPTF
jgi:hypothetical protein